MRLESYADVHVDSGAGETGLEVPLGASHEWDAIFVLKASGYGGDELAVK